MRTLREFAAEQLAETAKEYGPPSDPPEALERWVRRLIATGQVPDDILEGMLEVSRSNEPQVSPQEYECGCVAMVRVTDRDGRTWLGHDEKPFEMRLARPCDGRACELLHQQSSLPTAEPL
jgi:hypothetical protein